MGHPKGFPFGTPLIRGKVTNKKGDFNIKLHAATLSARLGNATFIVELQSVDPKRGVVHKR